MRTVGISMLNILVRSIAAGSIVEYSHVLNIRRNACERFINIISIGIIAQDSREKTFCLSEEMHTRVSTVHPGVHFL
jgi:hypothetical protein